MIFLSRIRFYVYVRNKKYGCFVVKAILNNRQQAKDYASEHNGFIEEVYEQW